MSSPIDLSRVSFLNPPGEEEFTVSGDRTWMAFDRKNQKLLEVHRLTEAGAAGLNSSPLIVKRMKEVGGIRRVLHYEFHRDSGSFLLFTPLCDGQELLSFLENNPPLPVYLALDMILDLTIQIMGGKNWLDWIDLSRLLVYEKASGRRLGLTFATYRKQLPGADSGSWEEDTESRALSSLTAILVSIIFGKSDLADSRLYLKKETQSYWTGQPKNSGEEETRHLIFRRQLNDVIERTLNSQREDGIFSLREWGGIIQAMWDLYCGVDREELLLPGRFSLPERRFKKWLLPDGITSLASAAGLREGRVQELGNERGGYQEARKGVLGGGRFFSLAPRLLSRVSGENISLSALFEKGGQREISRRHKYTLSAFSEGNATLLLESLPEHFSLNDLFCLETPLSPIAAIVVVKKLRELQKKGRIGFPGWGHSSMLLFLSERRGKKFSPEEFCDPQQKSLPPFQIVARPFPMMTGLLDWEELFVFRSLELEKEFATLRFFSWIIRKLLIKTETLEVVLTKDELSILNALENTFREVVSQDWDKERMVDSFITLIEKELNVIAYGKDFWPRSNHHRINSFSYARSSFRTFLAAAGTVILCASVFSIELPEKRRRKPESSPPVAPPIWEASEKGASFGDRRRRRGDYFLPFPEKMNINERMEAEKAREAYSKGDISELFARYLDMLRFGSAEARSFSLAEFSSFLEKVADRLPRSIFSEQRDAMLELAGKKSPVAMRLLGGLLEEEGDLRAAEIWYSGAAKLGDRKAVVARARTLIRNPEAPEEKTQKAVHTLARFPEREKNAEIQTLLGEASLKGRGTPKDLLKAISWLKKAMKQRNAEALVEGGKLLRDYYADSPEACQKAENFFLSAIIHGSVQGIYELGVHYFKNSAFADDKKLAFRLFRAAAFKGLPESMHALGKCFLYGIGSESNLNEAIRWHKRAAEGGHRRAARWCEKNDIEALP